MPKPSQSGYKRFFYNQNIKRDKSHKKYKNLQDHAVILLRRIEKEGMTNWLLDAVGKCQTKITAYGINLAQMLAVLENKGLDRLQSLLSDHFFFVQKKGAAKVATPSVKKEPAVKKTPVKKIPEDQTVEAKKPAVKKVAAKVATPSVKKEPAVKKTPVKKAATKTTKKSSEK